MKRRKASTPAGCILCLTTVLVLACHPSGASFDRPDIVITPEKTTLPMDIVLPLGKTVRIDVGQCTIHFREVLEDSVTGKTASGNGKVLLGVMYADSLRHVELNTLQEPRMYSLENGLFYKFESMNLRMKDGEYEIVLRFNAWARL